MAKKLIKKAQDGTELRKGQYKRIGRIAERNPERADRVADRMKTRASREERGKAIANPPKFSLNLSNEMREMREMNLDSQYKRAMLPKDTAKAKIKKSMAEGAMEAKSVPKKKMGGKITKKK